MAIRINEKKSINENTLLYQQRQHFAGVRYQETTPVFVNYYHVDPNETTAGIGFDDVAEIIGERSPIKYHKIEDFPLYNMDSIVLQLQEMDQGLDTEFESEGVILPGTIKPLQNDYFTIPILSTPYIFRVTAIQYDTTMPDSYYKITFVLDYIDDEKLYQLEKQVPKGQEYVSKLENIGTEVSCIIEKGKFAKVEDVSAMVRTIRQSYIAMFYSDRYNVFLGKFDDPLMTELYDPFQTTFINKHRLFNDRMDFQTILLTDQVVYTDNRYKYEQSVYRFIENPDVSRMQQFYFVHSAGVTRHESAFYRWRDSHIQVIDIIEHWPVEKMQIFGDRFVNDVIVNNDTQTEYGNFLKRYIRGEKLTITDIPDTLDEELVHLNHSFEVFFIIPILLYIIQKIIGEELHRDYHKL